MDFTKKFVKAKSPCADGFRWFVRHYKDGGNYQELLDALVADGRVNDACWLLDQFGPTDDVREVDAVDATAMVFAGTLHVRGNIDVDSLVRAGRSLIVDGGVRAGQHAPPNGLHGVQAGDDLRVGGLLACVGPLVVGRSLRVGWGIRVEGDVSCADDLRALWGLECTGNADVAGALFLGQDVQVDGDLRCGKTVTVGGNLSVGGSMKTGQGIVAHGDIACGMHLEAGWGVRSGGNISVACSLQAGEGIGADGKIETGEGYGVFAGLAVHEASWPTAARVQAAQRPERLMSGWWATA